MHIILTLVLLQLITVNIIDISGIIEYLKKYLHNRFIKIGDFSTLQLKPFDCSYCMTHWICLIYLLISGNFTLYYYAFVFILCLLTGFTADLMYWVKDIFQLIINALNKPIKQ